MQKFSRNLRVFGVIILVSLIAYIAMTFLSKNNNGSTEKLLVNIYFLNPVTNRIEPELHYVEPGENKEIATKVLKTLFEGPTGSKLVKTVNDKVEFIDGRIVNDSILEIEFSGNYNNMSPLEELFFRGSLVWTMTDLEFIQDIHIYVNGQELLTQAGKPMGLQNRKNVIIHTNIPPEPLNHRTVKLYFIKEGTGTLATESRTVRVKDLPIEAYIAEELIIGPSSQGLLPTIPQGTKVREVKTDEGICYLNLSAEFLNKQLATTPQQELAIYSIVNSLTELSSVKKVQFLIESEKPQYKEGEFDLSKPLEKNTDIVDKQ